MISSPEMQTGAALDLLWSFIARVEITGGVGGGLDSALLIRSLALLAAEYDKEDKREAANLIRASIAFVRAECGVKED